MERTERKLLSMIFGVTCFSSSASSVPFLAEFGLINPGKILGWDAKENGALLIVIWNAIILHARWPGVAKYVVFLPWLFLKWSLRGPGLEPICSAWVCMPMVSWMSFMPR